MLEYYCQVDSHGQKNSQSTSHHAASQQHPHTPGSVIHNEQPNSMQQQLGGQTNPPSYSTFTQHNPNSQTSPNLPTSPTSVPATPSSISSHQIIQHNSSLHNQSIQNTQNIQNGPNGQNGQNNQNTQLHDAHYHQHSQNPQNTPIFQNIHQNQNHQQIQVKQQALPSTRTNSCNLRRDSLKLQHNVLNFHPLRNWPATSESGLSLELIEQPCTEHRARYATEGAKGVIKSSDLNAYPTLRLSGYRLKEQLEGAQDAIDEFNRNNSTGDDSVPAYDRSCIRIEVFLATADGKITNQQKIKPNYFYRPAKVEGKFVPINNITEETVPFQDNDECLRISYVKIDWNLPGMSGKRRRGSEHDSGSFVNGEPYSELGKSLKMEK